MEPGKSGEEANWLTEYRQKNLEIYNKRPVKKSKYVSIEKLEELLKEKKADTQIEKKITGDAEVFDTIESAIEKFPEKMKEIFSKENKPQDQFGAFINAKFNSGFVIILGKNADGKKTTVEIDAKENQIIKYFIIAKEGISANIEEKITGKGNTLSSETIYLSENSKLNIVKTHAEKKGTISTQQCILEKDAQALNTNFWGKGEITKGTTSSVILGSGACAKEYSALMGSENQVFDINYIADHFGKGTESHCVFNSAMAEKSRSTFNGMIKIRKTGSMANALLECHSMILGENAESNQIPGLEIEMDDVKATHSATVKKIEEEDIFYMKARGIEESKAKKIIISGFIDSIVNKTEENSRKWIKEAIKEKTEQQKI